MSKTEGGKNNQESYDDNLKGTFISTIFVGLFVLLSWLGIFYIYLQTL